MKQSARVTIESITFTVANFPVSIKGVSAEANCEYNADEMSVESSAVCQVVNQISEKLGWLKPIAEKALQIKIQNLEILSENFKKKVAEGTQGAYGPNGWYAKSETVETEDYDPNKDYSCKVETKEN